MSWQSCGRCRCVNMHSTLKVKMSHRAQQFSVRTCSRGREHNGPRSRLALSSRACKPMLSMLLILDSMSLTRRTAVGTCLRASAIASVPEVLPVMMGRAGWQRALQGVASGTAILQFKGEVETARGGKQKLVRYIGRCAWDIVYHGGRNQLDQQARL